LNTAYTISEKFLLLFIFKKPFEDCAPTTISQSSYLNLELQKRINEI